MNRNGRSTNSAILSKVPQVTLLFWIIKILARTKEPVALAKRPRKT
jgi:uncharacterized membrane-anchored protein